MSLPPPPPPPPRRPDGAYPGGAYPSGYAGRYEQPTPQPPTQSLQTPRPAKDSEQLLAEALRAMASGAASLGSSASGARPAAAENTGPPIKSWTEIILLAGLIGLTIGIITGLISFYW